VREDSTERTIECDAVVLALGLKPDSELACRISGLDGIEVRVVGDTVRPRKVLDARLPRRQAALGAGLFHPTRDHHGTTDCPRVQGAQSIMSIDDCMRTAPDCAPGALAGSDGETS